MKGNQVNIQFKPFGFQHIATIERWLKEPHLAGIWNHEDVERMLEKHAGRVASDSVKQFIAFENQIPFGYIQFYWASRVGDGWWAGSEESCVGIDTYIGNPAFLGKGYGKALIATFVDALFKDPKINRIIADPAPKNLKIQRVLLDLGFKDCGPIRTPDGDAILFELRRPAH